jgi:hypothetical protein
MAVLNGLLLFVAIDFIELNSEHSPLYAAGEARIQN